MTREDAQARFYAAAKEGRYIDALIACPFEYVAYAPHETIKDWQFRGNGVIGRGDNALEALRDAVRKMEAV